MFKLISKAHQSEFIWRSRGNPVNKWYLRDVAAQQTSRTQCKLYFTGEIFKNRIGTKIDGTENQTVDTTQKLRLYSKVVKNIPPSFS